MSVADRLCATADLSLAKQWDPTLPATGQLASRLWMFANASLLRRVTVLPVMVNLALTALAIAFPANAHAVPAVWETSGSGILGMLSVTDSYGVSLWKYRMSTDMGNLFEFDNTMFGGQLRILASLFVVIGGFAIWLLMYVLSFGFLQDLVLPVAEGIQAYAEQVLPGIAVLAAIVAAVVIALNIIRGNAPKAVGQGAAAMVVALLAGAIAYTPITWTISDDGPLVQGRDLAIAAVTNSTASSGHAGDTLAQLEATLATNLVRRPLQAWNFGAVVDDTPSCAAAWSAGVNSGDADRIKDGVEDCGAPNSHAMKDSADNPDAGQIGAGVLLLFFVAIFLLYAIVTAYRIVAEFFRAVVSACKLLWGLAVGFIPGPAQRSIYTSAVELGYSAMAMFGYVAITVFVGQMFTVIFRKQGNIMGSTVSSVILMIVALAMLLRLGRSRRRASASIAESILDGLSPAPTPGTGLGGTPSGIPKIRAMPNTTTPDSGAFTNFAYNLPPPSFATGAAISYGLHLAGEKVGHRAPGLGSGLQRITAFLPSGPGRSVEKGLEKGEKLHDAAAKAKKAAPKPSSERGPGQPPPQVSGGPVPMSPAPPPLPGGTPGVPPPTEVTPVSSAPAPQNGGPPPSWPSLRPAPGEGPRPSDDPTPAASPPSPQARVPQPAAAPTTPPPSPFDRPLTPPNQEAPHPQQPRDAGPRTLSNRPMPSQRG
ncbi:hypothetical protein ACRCUN_08565 [Mycobacterium sp. LTG2003]